MHEKQMTNWRDIKELRV